MKKNILVIFGGKSVEHDISIITALQALSAIDRDKYNVIPCYNSTDGKFYTGEKLEDIESFINFSTDKLKQVVFLPGENKLAIKRLNSFKPYKAVDVALICCHGAYGEDGCLQGLLEMCDIPYSSCGVSSSSLCMDKAFMKGVFSSHNLPIVKHITLTRESFLKDQEKEIEKIKNSLTFPMIIKPANCGSSIGISACFDKDTLISSVALASEFDGKIIAESAITNLTEVNCAVLKVGDEILVSNLEQPLHASEILTFDEKYLTNPTKNQKQTLNEKEIKLKAGIKKQIKTLAYEAFLCCDCDGVCRIDFLIDNKENKVYINEINTIPGSLSNYLFDDLTFNQLIDKLIESAILKSEKKKKNAFNYKSPAILSYLKSGQKSRKNKLKNSLID